MKRVSIIMPIYNEENTLYSTLQSVLNQKYSNIEIILVNDGSTDDSLEVCNSIKKQDSRVKVYNKKNGGVSSARNLGIEKATGDYICFIDADDSVSEKYVEQLLLSIEKTQVDAVFSGYNMAYGQSILKRKQRLETGIYNSQEISSILLDDGTMTGILFGSVCSAIYKTSVIRDKSIKFLENLKVNEDGIFNIEFLLNSKNVYVNNNIFPYNYNQERYRHTNPRNYSQLSHELNKVDVELKNKFEYEIENFHVQIHQRQISKSLWLILNIGSSGNYYKDVRKQLKQVVKTSKKSINFIDVKKLSKHKKFYYYLIKYQLTFLLYFSTKYLVPILAPIMNR